MKGTRRGMKVVKARVSMALEKERKGKEMRRR